MLVFQGIALGEELESGVFQIPGGLTGFASGMMLRGELALALVLEAVVLIG